MFTRLALLVLQWGLYGLVSRNLEDSHGYTGIGFVRPSVEAVLLSLAALALVAAVLPSRLGCPSQAALWLLASFVVTPTLAVAAMNPNFDSSVSVRAVSIVMIGLFITAFLTRRARPSRRIRQAGVASPSGYVAVVVAVAVVGILTVMLGLGVTSFDLSLDTETVRRLAARATSPPFPGAFYLFAWLKSVLVPLLLVLSIHWRIPLLAALSLLGTALVFSFSAEKAAFVYPLIALLVYFSVRRCKVDDPRPWLGMLLTAVIGVPMVVSSVLPASGLDVLVTRRIGLIPAQLTHSYVEYVDGYGVTWFSQSFLRFESDGDDLLSMGMRVGRWLDSSGDLNANANVWADGYGSAGFLGVALTAVLLGLVLRFFDALSTSRDSLLATAVLGTVCFEYVDGYFHTSLLSGGVVFAALLVWASPLSPPFSRSRPIARTFRRT